MTELTVRRARADDLSFVVAAVIAAESSGAPDGRTTYEALFGLTRGEIEPMLRGLLAQPGSGHQLTLDSFFVAEDGAGPVAACAAWIEAADGRPSGFKSAALLAATVGGARWMAARPRIRALASCAPPRTPGALQMETFYVVPESRGRGLTTVLVQQVIQQFLEQGRVPSVEIALLSTNVRARAAYLRAGFAVHTERPSSDPLFFEVTGGGGFVQMRAVPLSRPHVAPAQSALGHP